MKVLKIILQYKYFYWILLTLTVFLSLYRINHVDEPKKFLIKNEYTIQNVKYQNNHYVVELKNKETYISYFNEFPYDIGDIVKIEGNLVNITNNTFFNNFNYKDYLKIRGIFYELKVGKMELLKKNTNILIKIKKWFHQRINMQDNKDFLYALVLGDTTFLSSEMKEQFNYNGLSHIFVLGSLKIMIIAKLLLKIKRKLKLKEKSFILLVSLVFFIYCYLVDMKIGVVKSALIFLLKRIFKHYRLNIKYEQIILLAGSILLIVNPCNIINSAFYYSFIISLGLIYHGKKNFSKRNILLLSFQCFLLTIPLNIYYNYEINFLAIILNILVVPLIHYLIFPLCILSFILPFLHLFLSFFLSFLIDINTLFSNITIFSFAFRKPSIIIVIIYYGIIFLCFQKKKKYWILLLFLIIYFNVNKIIPESLVLFFDVKQGDSILIKNNNSNTLIDTGSNINYDFNKKIIKTLKSFGIDKIDNLVITHGDYDHMGEAINLVNNFKVEKVIFNCGEFNDLEKELIKVLDKKKIKYYSCIKELNIDNSKLYFLQTKEYDNENDNSNVIYTELNGYKFMFMGDASITTEKEIIDKYNLPNIDVLKVGHHGSKTSSSKEFINEINPRYSIISVGKNNRYGHPNKEVLNNLEDSKMYRTDHNGSIMFKIKNNKLKIETCSP